MAVTYERPTIHMVVMPKGGDAQVFTIEDANIVIERGYFNGGFVKYEAAPFFDNDKAARLHGWIPAIRRTIETLELIPKEDDNG